MDNAEEIMQSLEEFAKVKPKDIPNELDDYLSYVAKTGDPVFKWSIIKCLFREKLLNVITDFYESTLTIELPPCPNVDTFNYERMKANLLEKLDTFQGAPFTVQRISELLTNPRKEYNRADKFMRAIEKNILVVSTREPGRFAEGESETDPSYNGMPEANESVVETVFPSVNDFPDRDPTTATYALESSSSDAAEQYSVNVEAVAETSGQATLEPQSQEESFVVSQSHQEPGEVSLDLPGTSAESKDDSVLAKESESVICSTPMSAAQETLPSDRPEALEVDGPEQPQDVLSEQPLDVVGQEPVASTSEALPIEIPSAEPVEPEPSTSHIPQEVDEPEQPQLEELPPTDLQETMEADTCTPQPTETIALDVKSVDESSSPIPENNEVAEASSSEEIQQEASNITVDPEIQVQSSEATSFEDDRPAECDMISSSEEPSAPQQTVEDQSTDEQFTKTVEAVTSEAGDIPAPQEDKVSASEEVPTEVQLLPLPETTDGSGDQTRESCIHSTSVDEPMEVDECQTTTEETPEPW